MRTFKFEALIGKWQKSDTYVLTEEDRNTLSNGTQEEIAALGNVIRQFEQFQDCNEEETGICTDYLERNKPTLEDGDNFVLNTMVFPYVGNVPLKGAMSFSINGEWGHKLLK